MGAACSSCDAFDGLIEYQQEIKDQVIRDVHDEVNGSEACLDKSTLGSSDMAVVLRASSPRTPSAMDAGATPRLLGSLSTLSQRDESRKGSRKNTLGSVVQLSAIPEQQQAIGFSASWSLTALQELALPTPRTPTPRTNPRRASSVSPLSRTDRMSNASNATVCGTPRTPGRWPSITTIESVSEQVARFPISSYPVSNEPVKLLSRHIAFAPSPTHSVHQSEHGVIPYGEIYGEHPMLFEFDGEGNKIPRAIDDSEMLLGGSRQCIETVRGLKRSHRRHA